MKMEDDTSSATFTVNPIIVYCFSQKSLEIKYCYKSHEVLDLIQKYFIFSSLHVFLYSKSTWKLYIKHRSFMNFMYLMKERMLHIYIAKMAF